MARYADSLLADGEQIALRTRQHWLATVIEGKTGWSLVFLAVVLLVLAYVVGPGSIRTVVSYAGLAVLLLGLLWLVRVFWEWWAEDYLVTNRRVIKVQGILNKRSMDSSLEKINDAVLDQNLIGRILGYGDLDILTASDSAIDRFRMLRQAPTFKKVMLDQKHDLETEFSRMPGPPLRSQPALAATDPAAPAGGPSPTPSAPVRQATSAEEITDAVARLAGLRDSGAITPAEFEAKKAELLSRL